MLSLNRTKKTESAYAFLIFVSCFVLAFVVGSLTFIPRDSSAESADAEVELTIEPVVALSVSPQPTLLLDLTPTPAGFEVAEEITVDVSTNNLTGYILTMNAISNTTALTHTNTVNTMPSTASLTAAALPTNNWGYNKGAGATSFLRIPPLSTPDTLTTSTVPITNDTTIVTVGAKADINILPGVYSNTLVFTAVGNYTPQLTITSVDPSFVASAGNTTITVTGTGFYGAGASSAVTSVTIGGTACASFSVTSDTSLTCITPALVTGVYAVVVTTSGGTSNADVTVTVVDTMQDFTTAKCTAMRNYYPPGSPPANSEVDLMDVRDGKVYKIRRLPNDSTFMQGGPGWCWMVDNLDLRPMTLDSATSDMASGTYNLTSTNARDANILAYCIDRLNGTVVDNRGVPYRYGCGWQYAWNGATTGSTITTGNAPNSICPKNWMLPPGPATAANDRSYNSLVTAMGWASPATLRGNVVVDSSWRGLYAGLAGSAGQGAQGMYMTSTVYDSTNNRNLWFGTTNTTTPIDFRLKTQTMSVRCVAR